MNRGRRQALILAGTMGSVAALAAFARPPRPDADARAALSLDTLFPRAFGDWRIDPLSRAFVRPADRQGKLYQIYDQVLERTFVDGAGQRIMLSVAFGSEQSSSLQMHRPEVCYRAAGYTIRAVQPGTLKVAGRVLHAMRVDAALPGRPEPITYWTLLGGAVVHDAASARRRRLQAVLRHELLDGLLVRVSSIDDDRVRAHALQDRFADELVAAIAPADRPKVVGTHPEG